MSLAGSRRPALKRWGAWVHDVLWAAAVMAGCLAVRYHFEHKPLPPGLLMRWTAVFAGVCAAVFPLMRLERGVWRFTALNDIARIATAVGAALLVTLPLMFWIDRLADFPRSALPMVFLALVAGLSLGRGIARAHAQGDLAALLRLEDRSRPAAVIVGSPAAAAAYLAAARRRPDRGLRIAGIVTTDAVAEAGRTIGGAELKGGLPRLASILKALAAAEGPPPQVLVAEPRPGRALLDTVVAAAAEVGARVSRVRASGGGADLAAVQAADLLDRPPRMLDAARARALVEGRRVLVTGAGGTIGSELTRQVLALAPESLTLVDASEFNLYALDAELRGSHPTGRWTAVLADVRDAARMAQVFADARPQVVLHAAALKHVPLMEQNPTEAVRTNVGGALTTARLAREHADVFVFISTDKAVNPTNVMGATKRAAERVVRAVAKDSPMRAAVVRFGNVLGSTGSVAPLFERQIAEGGPLTVTHRDMVRFFMTVQEAASLVLQAAALPGGGEAQGEDRVYVLDMGEPVRIDDLARQMIRLHGLRPDTDIAIAYTGLRPGEKLYEEIFYADEDVRETGADGVLAAVDAAGNWAELEGPVRALLAAAEAQEEAATLERLASLVPAFTRGAA